MSSTVEINSIWQKEILRKICFGDFFDASDFYFFLNAKEIVNSDTKCTNLVIFYLVPKDMVPSLLY